MRLWTGEGSIDDAEQLGLAALPALEERQDHAGLAQMWFALAFGVYNYAGRFEKVVHASETAGRYETLAGRPHRRSDQVRAIGLLYGPRPAEEVLRDLDTLDSTWRVDVERAVLLAMTDRIDEARALGSIAAEHAQELGQGGQPDLAEIETLAGDHNAAAELMGLWLDWDASVGITGNIGFKSAWRSRQLALAGRYEEAEQCLAEARAHADTSPGTNTLWRQAAALVKSSRGAHGDAERLAREALVYVLETDALGDQGDVYCDLAAVLEAAGRREEALAAWHEALDRYERKGIVPLAREVRERLASLEPA
jgi:tetratricopeptide (TPR) repeat protein